MEAFFSSYSRWWRMSDASVHVISRHVLSLIILRRLYYYWQTQYLVVSSGEPTQVASLLVMLCLQDFFRHPNECLLRETWNYTKKCNLEMHNLLASFFRGSQRTSPSSDGSFTLVMIKVPHAPAISIISEPIQDPLGHPPFYPHTKPNSDGLDRVWWRVPHWIRDGLDRCL